MYKKLIVGMALLFSFAQVSSAETKKECQDNADLFGYATTIAADCSYEISQRHSKLIADINKSCIKKYGDKLTFNASIAGVHAAKQQIIVIGRNAACSQAYDEYKSIFE